jgi:hypothetical protein
MKLGIRLMALLIVFYQIIQQLQMEKTCLKCLKCYIEYNALTCGKYVVFQSPMYMKALLSKHPFYIQFKIIIILHCT